VFPIVGVRREVRRRQHPVCRPGIRIPRTRSCAACTERDSRSATHRAVLHRQRRRRRQHARHVLAHSGACAPRRLRTRDPRRRSRGVRGGDDRRLRTERNAPRRRRQRDAHHPIPWPRANRVHDTRHGFPHGARHRRRSRCRTRFALDPRRARIRPHAGRACCDELHRARIARRPRRRRARGWCAAHRDRARRDRTVGAEDLRPHHLR
jgi:hypothetical protein